jgi:hypothetical protein
MKRAGQVFFSLTGGTYVRLANSGSRPRTWEDALSTSILLYAHVLIRFRLTHLVILICLLLHANDIIRAGHRSNFCHQSRPKRLIRGVDQVTVAQFSILTNPLNERS